MRKLDNDQQKAVDVRKNAVIRAGAGAGKTTVLATRFLDIVKKGEAAVDEILTLTFTQKAAAEMKERIYKTLIADKDNPVISSQIDAFGGAQISTIDSFCSEIARSGASLFGINSEFVSDLPRLRRNIESLAREFIFSKADTSVVSRLVTEMGYKGVAEELLVHMAENYFSPARPLSLENAVTVQQAILLRDARIFCDYLGSFLKTCAEFDPKEGKTMQNLQAVDSAVFAGAFSDGLSVDSYAVELEGIKEAAALVRKITKPRESKKDGLSYVRDHIDDVKDAVGRLEIILMTLENEDFVKEFIDLVCEFQDQVIEFKRTSGVLSFGDIMDLAIAVLLENKDIRRYYKQRFKFIMVDEFQDNNSKQKELIYLLAEHNDIEGDVIPTADKLEKEKLFFVGDEKQSIYRFRGADVSVFKTLSMELEDAGGESITLGTNYRSEPALIRWFNEIFPAVFGDAEYAYEAGFDPLKFRPQESDPRVDITVALQEELEGADYLQKVESEAWHAACYIKNAVAGASGVRIPLRDGGDRLPRYSDFVILMRSTGNSRYFEAMLRHFGIPYETQEPRSLFLAAPINDMYNLLQLVLYPSDMIAMAAYFRSPLCRIDDSLLTELFVYMKERRISSLFTLSLDKEFVSDARFSDDAALSSALALYMDISERARSYESAELVQHIWFAGGYHHHVVRFPEFAGHYDFIREAASVYPSLCEFIDWMRPKLGAAEKLEDAKVFADKGNAVEIMTVHKSKGLEFPIVILADAGNEGLNRGAGSMRYVHDPEWGIAPQMRDEKEKPVNYFYSRGQDEELAMEHAELKRLLYVALTRAENHLYISGSVKSTKEKWSFLKLLLLNEDVKVNSIELPSIKKQEMLLTSTGTQNVHEVPVPVKSQLSFPEQIRRVSDLEGSLGGGNIIAMPSLDIDSLIKGIENEFGTLCHRIIEYRIAAGLYDFVTKVDIRAFHFPVLVSDSISNERILNAAVELTNNLFSGACGTFIRQAEIVDSEYALIIKQDNYGMRGTVDLVCIYADHIKVVDFKTDLLFNTRHYEPQIRAYCEAVSAIYGKQVVGYLINLRDNEMRKIYEFTSAYL